MSEDKMFAAMREFIRIAVELEVKKATLEVRSVEPKVIEGPAGKDGSPGKDGIDGKDGRDGKDGTPGIGERGADGLNGKDGKDGSPGSDGAPSIIPGPAGPKGERGADGIATREELESLIETRFAELQVRSFADAYRSVFKHGESYKRGEFSTWGGSLFLALADTENRPGESSDWQLVVKRGADGKDVRR